MGVPREPPSSRRRPPHHRRQEPWPSRRGSASPFLPTGKRLRTRVEVGDLGRGVAVLRSGRSGPSAISVRPSARGALAAHHLGVALHLIEQPIDRTWFAGAGSPAAMAHIASRSSRRSSKNRQFLADPTGMWYCFSEKARRGLARPFIGGRGTAGSESEPGRRKEMAPQAFEITQNGTGNGASRLCATASAISGASALHRP